MSTEASARAFMSAPNFAVVGASSDPRKFGHKIFNWYIHHSLPATPINASSSTISAYPNSTSYDTLPSVSKLPNPKETSVSIITPPHVTIKVLEEAKNAGIEGVWLQPGTWDDNVMKYAEENFKTVVGGDGGAGSEGWCVLVDGEKALEGRGKERL